VLAELDARALSPELKQAAELVATVVGQDLEALDHGVFRIARRVAPDRVISTVDPEARHGHKTSARGFDGYKGHVAIDPDSELITRTAVSAGNAGDASVAHALLADVFEANANKTSLDIQHRCLRAVEGRGVRRRILWNRRLGRPARMRERRSERQGAAAIRSRRHVLAGRLGRYRMLSQRGACATARPAGQLAGRGLCGTLCWLFAPTTMHDLEERSRAAPPSKARDAHSRA
jgi:hypothetical protein